MTQGSYLPRFLASLYRMTPMTVREYPHIPVTDIGFRKIKMEITTATAPFAFPRTWHNNYDFVSDVRYYR